MLVDLLDQSIIDMKEINELEKSSNDVQKQEKNDKIFSNVVSENHLMVKAVTNSMSQLGFVISQETRGKVIGLLKSSCDAVSRGLIQESTANYLQKEVFNIKKASNGNADGVRRSSRMIDRIDGKLCRVVGRSGSLPNSGGFLADLLISSKDRHGKRCILLSL